MKRITLLLVISFMLLNLFSTPTGVTATIPDDGQGFWSGNRAVEGRPELNITSSETTSINHERWQEVSRIEFDEYLEPGTYLGIEYNPWNFQFTKVSNQSGLNSVAESAIARAPEWLKSQLRYTLSQLSNSRQTVWGNTILDAVTPYIDEVCYAVAWSSPGYLTRQDIYPELMHENARLMYDIADELQFVSIVDQGNEASGDWYSTTQYRKMDEFGIERWVTVDRDTYYMYVVHPKITDEIPNYIDPDHSESNSSHANNFAEPPVGRFWREYLYYHNDDGYPKLRDMLANCQYVMGSPVSEENAIMQINSWVSQSMVFTSEAERPHQPVRIYDKHIGRCGEHQDLRGACGRIALIPTKGINCISGDHVWNEFWDERWIHWDGGGNSLDNPLLYENGWGRHYGSIFEQRSDGKFIPVSDKYSDGYATLNIWAIDAENNPIDGASVYLRVEVDGDPYFDNVGVTDDTGLCTFIVGEDRKYYARVNSVIQNMPSSGYDLLVDNAANNAVYDFTFQATQTMMVPDVSYTPVPDSTGTQYKIETHFFSNRSLIIGNSVFDDASGGLHYQADYSNGGADLYMTDSINFAAATSGLPFAAFHSYHDMEDIWVQFFTNTDDFWYSFFMNGHNVVNPKHVQGSFVIYTTDPEYQTGTMDITVLNENEEPIPGATIVLEPNDISFEATESNISIDVAQGTYDVYCYPGEDNPNYLPTAFTGVYVSAGEIEVLEFVLEENANPVSRLTAVDEGQQVHLSWEGCFNSTRDLESISLFRGEVNSELTINDGNLYLVAEMEQGDSYIDTDWSQLPSNVYRWMIVANYTGGEHSIPVYSNIIEKDMTVAVDFNITTNTDIIPDGAIITLTNYDDVSSHQYEGIYENQSCILPNVWLGEYYLTVTFADFEFYDDDLLITADETIDVELIQNLTVPGNCSVSEGVLSWYPCNFATAYKVYLDGTLQTETTEIDYTFAGLSADVNYLAGVKAVYETGESELYEIGFVNGSSVGFGKIANFSFNGDSVESINNININEYGTIEYSDDAVSGQSVVLDGFSSYLESDNSPILNSAATHYTVKIWVKPRIPVTNWTGIVGKPGRNYNIWTHPNGYIHHRFHTDTGTNNGIGNTNDGVMNWGEWNHIVITNDGTVGKTYVNGVLEQSGTFSGDLIEDDTPLIFGRHLDGNSMNCMLDGKLDECVIWDRALSESEVAMVYLEEMIPEGTITGSITDANNTPIEGAIISVGYREVVSSSNGGYLIAVQPADYEMHVTASGYSEYVQNISVTANDAQSINISLTEALETPMGLAVFDNELSWCPVGLDNDRDFTEYKVYLEGSEVATTQDTSYTFTNLNPDQTYMASVEASFDTGISQQAEIGFKDGSSLSYMNTLNLPLDGDYSEEHGNTPTSVNGDLTFVADEAFDNYLEFDGVGDYLELLTTDLLGFYQSSFTASAWVKLASDDTNDKAIFGTNFSGATNGGLHLMVRTGRVSMRFYGNDTNQNHVLMPGVWYHVTYRYDIDAQKQEMFVNGELIKSGENKTPFDNAGTPVFIGQADGSRFFEGGMKHINIWNRALSSAELLNSYNSTAPDYGYISGVVTYAGDGEPMAGVTVTVNDVQATTDAEGYYMIPVTEGTWDVSFKPGLHTEFIVENVIVTVGETSQVDYSYDFTGNNDAEQLSIVTALNAVYPNPFNPTTTISFSLKSTDNVKLTVYDIKGRKVVDLVDATLGAGGHTVSWNGEDNNGKSTASGIYLIKMSTNSYESTRKAVLMK